MDVTAMMSAAGSSSPMLALPPGLGVGPGKDSRWLTLEVCREFQRSRCTRSDLECKFAHPPPHVEVQNGRVTCCFDSIKGKCSRKEPPCKYLHPPQHLKEQLLQNGRNNLILRAHATQHLFGTPGGQILPPPHPAVGMMPTLAYDMTGRPSYAAGAGGAMLPMQSYLTAAHPYLSAAGGYFSPYAALSAANYMQATADGGIFTSASTSMPSTTAAAGASVAAAQQKAMHASSDRLEASLGMAGMQPTAYIKRQAMDGKSGMPMYPHMATMPSAAAYQHFAALAQPPGAYLPISFPGPAGMPRF